MFDSFGLGEWGIVAVVAILFVDPKKVGSAARAFAKLRRKWNDIQREVKQQIDALTLEENLRESVEGIRSAKSGLRAEAREAVRALPAAERAEKAEKILARLKEWPSFKEAKVIALFSGTLEEIDTEGIIRHALAEGKTVLLPYIRPESEIKSHMEFAALGNYDRDLVEGAFGILEPKEELRTQPAPEPDLILVPGTAFDERGGRVGRGRGFYDRYLEDKNALKIGLAFQVQIRRKKLALEAHDRLLDGLVTEERLLSFAQPASG